MAEDSLDPLAPVLAPATRVPVFRSPLSAVEVTRLDYSTYQSPRVYVEPWPVLTQFALMGESGFPLEKFPAGTWRSIEVYHHGIRTLITPQTQD